MKQINYKQYLNLSYKPISDKKSIYILDKEYNFYDISLKSKVSLLRVKRNYREGFRLLKCLVDFFYLRKEHKNEKGIIETEKNLPLKRNFSKYKKKLKYIPDFNFIDYLILLKYNKQLLEDLILF